MDYEQLTEELNKHLIYNFINDTEGLKSGEYKGLKFEGIEDLDQESYNSYGYEDSILKRVYFFPDYNCHVMFSGTRASYDGEN